MSSHNDDHLDVNAAAEGQCSHCGTARPFAQAHLYMDETGLVARCADCENVLLCLVKAKQRVLLDLRGMVYLSVNVA